MAAQQAMGAGGDQHLVGLGMALHPRGQGGRFTDRHARSAGVAVAQVGADHHRPGGDGDAQLQRLRRGNRLDRVEQLQATGHRATGVVLMRARPAEVHRQPVAQVLRDHALVVRHHLGAGLLVGLHQRAQVFRVQPLRQRGRADHVAAQHGELATLGRAGSRGTRWRQGDTRDRGQLRSGLHQPDPVPQCLDPDLRQLRVAQAGQHVEIDRLLLKRHRVLRQAQPFEPGRDRGGKVGVHRVDVGIGWGIVATPMSGWRDSRSRSNRECWPKTGSTRHGCRSGMEMLVMAPCLGASDPGHAAKSVSRTCQCPGIPRPRSAQTRR